MPNKKAKERKSFRKKETQRIKQWKKDRRLERKQQREVETI